MLTVGKESNPKSTRLLCRLCAFHISCSSSPRVNVSIIIDFEAVVKLTLSAQFWEFPGLSVEGRHKKPGLAFVVGNLRAIFERIISCELDNSENKNEKGWWGG